jgi:rhodanese-related sulfurtransferase
MIKNVASEEIRRAVIEARIFALVDVREQRFYGQGHILPAVNIPLSRIEIKLPDLVPGKNTPLVFYDDGGDLAEIAANTAQVMGYSDIAILNNGLSGWKAGNYHLFSGTHVLGAALAESIDRATPIQKISASELSQMQNNGESIVVLDARPWDAFIDNHIPGGINCPLGELEYRFRDLVGDDKTPVVVNCAGRTRSILGARSLLIAGVPNPVYSLDKGTWGWWSAGLKLASGSGPRADTISEKGRGWSFASAQLVAREAGVKEIDEETLARWESEQNDIPLYLLDVRLPGEFESGHLADAISAPACQLIECSEDWIGVRNGRILLIDDDGVRARVVAYWLKKLGYQEVAVLSVDFKPEINDPGKPVLIDISKKYPSCPVDAINPEAVVLDLSPSTVFQQHHIPGALWFIRSYLKEIIGKIPDRQIVVMDDEEGRLARLVVEDLAKLGRDNAYLLDGDLESWRSSGASIESGDNGMLTAIDDCYYASPHSEIKKMRMKKAYMDWQSDMDLQIIDDGIISLTG